MQLFVIGPAKGGPVTVGLAKDAEAHRDAIQAAHPVPLVVHAAHELERGWDSLACGIAVRSLNHLRAANEGWFKCPAGPAVTAVSKAVRGVTLDPKNPPAKPDYQALIRHIRVQILDTTQEVLGAIAGVHGSKVSRWESGDLDPGLYELFRIRDFIGRNGLSWNDSWAFVPPE